MLTKEDEVAEVLRQLKQEVRRQGKASPSTLPTRRAALEQIHAASRVNPHLPIAWPTWPPGIVPKIVALFQKVIRRLLRWYINPIVEQQNNFNAAVAEGFDDLYDQIAQLQTAWREEQEALRSEWELKLSIMQSQWQAELGRIYARLAQLGADEHIDSEEQEQDVD